MGVKISELNEALSVQNSDVLPIVQNGETKKINKQTLFEDTSESINNLQEQIDNLALTSITITSDYTIDNNSCFKSQNYVVIGFNIYNSNSTFSTYGWTKIAQLPSGSRPSTEIYFPTIAVGSGLASPTAVPARVTSDGEVFIYPVVTNLKRVIANATIMI